MKRLRKKSILAPLICLCLIVLSLWNCRPRPDRTALDLGIWAAEHNLWDEAIFHWQQALKDNPSSAAAYNNLAVAYEKKGLWDKALKAYEEALRLDPKNRFIKANLKKLQTRMQLASSEDKEPRQKNQKK